MQVQKHVRFWRNVSLVCWLWLAASPTEVASSSQRQPPLHGSRRLQHEAAARISMTSGPPAVELHAPAHPFEGAQQGRPRVGNSSSLPVASSLLESSGGPREEARKAAAQAAVYNLLQEQGQLQGAAAEEPAVFKVDGGDDAPPGRFPYMCSLREPNYNRMFCAGTLIHPSLVLTAAHCLGRSNPSYDIRDITIICGDYILAADNGTDIRRLRDFALHPNWNLRRRGSDIALIWLDKPASNTPTVQVMSPEQWASVGVAGQELWGAGWGRINFVDQLGERPQYPLVLQQFKAPIINTSRCNDDDVYAGKVDPETMICVGWLGGGWGPSSCKGDSGGPMVYAPGSVDNSASHVQVGIVSWSGESCGTTRDPDVDTKVAAFYSWIQQAVSEVDATNTSKSGVYG